MEELKKPKVWMIPLSAEASLDELKIKTSQILHESKLLSIISKNKIVAVKQHFGEKDNEGFIKPEVTKVVISKIKERLGRPLLVETNTLYHGQRSNTYDHLNIAYEHGFTFDKVGAPIVIMDGLNGQIRHEVEIDGKHFKKVYLVPDIPFFDSLVVLSHVKGHGMAGIGGAIKNLGMGMASRAGKLAQHSDFRPHINYKKCVACGVCTQFCNHEALKVIDKKLTLFSEKCVGCGGCYTACTREAITFSWAGVNDTFQEKLAEYAYGAAKHHCSKGKTVFINYFYHVTKHCDCEGGHNPVLFNDVAILASADPVAVDKAAYDLGLKTFGRDIFKELWPEIHATRQIEHAESLGLGSTAYELIELK